MLALSGQDADDCREQWDTNCTDVTHGDQKLGAGSVNIRFRYGLVCRIVRSEIVAKDKGRSGYQDNSGNHEHGNCRPEIKVLDTFYFVF